MIPRTYIVFLCAGWAAVLSCRPKPTPGAGCHVPAEIRCDGPDRAAVCRAGAWSQVRCKGPAGCVHGGEMDDCDDTVASAGDACPANPPIDYACTATKTAALVCRDGRFALWRNCRGSEGCAVGEGHRLNCDTTLGEPGDPCEQAGTYSCSVDGQRMLTCDGQSLAPASSCRGPQGCHFDRERHTIDCDDGVALEGDPCDRPHRITCGVDHKSELVCEEKQYAKKRECRRADCRIESGELFCD